MGKLKTFVVVFDQNKDVYLSGEIVSGKVIAEVYEGIKAREIGDKAGESPILPPGYYGFPFRYELGTELPSSFEGGTGHVRYSINGIIDRPWRFDHTAEGAFTVLDMYDLNLEPNAQMPSGNQNSKTLCCLCCKSGPIELQAQTDRGGYCPGEVVGVRGSVENNSNTLIYKTSAKLVQIVTDHATKDLTATPASGSDYNTLSSAVGLGCRGRTSGNIGELLVPIPPAPPSVLRHCSIIDTKYIIEVTAHIKGPHLSLKVALPIIIGSIPLRSVYGGVPQMGAPTVHGIPDYSMTGGDPTAPATPDYFGATAPVPDYYMATAPPPNPPLPSYAEATGGAANIRDSQDNDHTMGQLSFAPKYMYYDWSQHPQP